MCSFISVIQRRHPHCFSILMNSSFLCTLDLFCVIATFQRSIDDIQVLRMGWCEVKFNYWLVWVFLDWSFDHLTIWPSSFHTIVYSIPRKDNGGALSLLQMWTVCCLVLRWSISCCCCCQSCDDSSYVIHVSFPYSMVTRYCSCDDHGCTSRYSINRLAIDVDTRLSVAKPNVFW